MLFYAETFKTYHCILSIGVQYADVFSHHVNVGDAFNVLNVVFSMFWALI